MLEHGSITPIEYNNLNTVIAIPELSSDEGGEEGDIKIVIKGTVDHVIQHDKEELSNLLMEFLDEIGK